MSDEEAKIEAKRQAEGMAVGSGCRYSSRAIEECFGLNPKMSKAAILNGWREMDGYMRENNIVVAAPEGDEDTARKSEEAAPKTKGAGAAPEQSPAQAAEAPSPSGTAAPKKTQAAPQSSLTPRQYKQMI